MKKFYLFLIIAFFVTLSGCGGGASQLAEVENVTADWSLKTKPSYIHYTTVKQEGIAEPNSFSIFTGSVSASGEARVSIALNSVQTNVDTRDERMKRLVFKTSDFPMATISTTIPMQTLSALENGGRQSITESLAVSMAGMEAVFEVDFKVTRLGLNSVLVESERPIYVQSSDFGFEAAVSELQILANLDSITPVVPVSFSLVFER